MSNMHLLMQHVVGDRGVQIADEHGGVAWIIFGALVACIHQHNTLDQPTNHPSVITNCTLGYQRTWTLASPWEEAQQRHS